MGLLTYVPGIFTELYLSADSQAQERDTEWNTVGISSGLNPVEWKKAKQKKILSNMAEYIRAAASLKANSQDNLDEFLKSFNAKGTISELHNSYHYDLDHR